MASGNPGTPAVAQQTQNRTASQEGETPQALKTWWTAFTRRPKKDNAAIPVPDTPAGIFGVPLNVSIKYANVAISLMNEQGESFIYGYVPIVVAKCGVFLKEKATDVAGIFRLSGSNKRIKELQAIFDSPDRYGKGLDWTGYTVHDAANILRRYLNQLPQPIVPLDFYEKFRDPLRTHQTQAVGDMEAAQQDMGDFDQTKAIITYQRLITELPPLNRQLLLYILDLLAVFASKSDINLMTSANLAAIFQPGLLSHPNHDMSPQEYRLSQDVLIFLIDNQDSFLIGMSGTAADEKTVRDVQNGPQSLQPSTPTSNRTSQVGLGRSASNASAGADSLRKHGGIRRNLSVSSKNSRSSSHVPSPLTPSPGSGVHRSNTLPSKKSPALSSGRFTRGLDSPTTPSANLSPITVVLPSARAPSPVSRLTPTASEHRTVSVSSSTTPTTENPMNIQVNKDSGGHAQSNDQLLPTDNLSTQINAANEPVPHSMHRPSAVRKVSNLLMGSPSSDADRKDGRQPNKLRKKQRIPSSTTASAHSSTNSLSGAPDSPNNLAFYTPMPTPGVASELKADPIASTAPIFHNTAPTPQPEMTPAQSGDGPHDPILPREESESTLKPNKSPARSVRSKKSSITDQSDPDHTGAVSNQEEKPAKKSRWRFSSSAKRNGQIAALATATPQQIGSNAIADTSTSSIGSWSRSRRSETNDSHQLGTEPSSSGFPSIHSSQQVPANEPATPTPLSVSKENSKEKEKEKEASQETTEKKGPLSWIKAKVAQAKEDKKEREAEKERAKSPPRNGADRAGSKHSVNALAAQQETLPPRGRSIDAKRSEEVQPARITAEPTSPPLTAVPVTGPP